MPGGKHGNKQVFDDDYDYEDEYDYDYEEEEEYDDGATTAASRSPGTGTHSTAKPSGDELLSQLIPGFTPSRNAVSIHPAPAL